jgi:hypothetical protein
MTTLIRGQVQVKTWPHERGYTAKYTWIQSHMHVAHNKILHVDTWLLIHADAYRYITSEYTWDPILIQFEAGTNTALHVAHSAEPESALWPTVLNQILHSGP